jgi:hypothetical protein
MSLRLKPGRILMAWGRIVEMEVGDELGFGLVISDLHTDFKVERSITLSENTAEFTIYNAKEITRNEVLKQGNNVIFRAGYADEEVGTIFVGNITEASSVKSGADWQTRLTCVSRNSNQKLEKVIVKISFNRGTLISKAIKEVASLLGLVVNGIENADVEMPNGIVYTGKSNGALRELQGMLLTYNKDMYIDNNELVVYNIGEASTFKVVLLSYKGGLLNIEDTVEVEKVKVAGQRRTVDVATRVIKFTSLLIPQLQPNAPVTFKTDKVDGTFVVEKLTFEGNNYGGDFLVEGEARE